MAAQLSQTPELDTSKFPAEHQGLAPRVVATHKLLTTLREQSSGETRTALDGLLGELKQEVELLSSGGKMNVLQATERARARKLVGSKRQEFIEKLLSGSASQDAVLGLQDKGTLTDAFGRIAQDRAKAGSNQFPSEAETMKVILTRYADSNLVLKDQLGNIYPKFSETNRPTLKDAPLKRLVMIAEHYGEVDCKAVVDKAAAAKVNAKATAEFRGKDPNNEGIAGPVESTKATPPPISREILKQQSAREAALAMAQGTDAQADLKIGKLLELAKQLDGLTTTVLEAKKLSAQNPALKKEFEKFEAIVNGKGESLQNLLEEGQSRSTISSAVQQEKPKSLEERHNNIRYLQDVVTDHPFEKYLVSIAPLQAILSAQQKKKN